MGCWNLWMNHNLKHPGLCISQQFCFCFFFLKKSFLKGKNKRKKIFFFFLSNKSSIFPCLDFWANLKNVLVCFHCSAFRELSKVVRKIIFSCLFIYSNQKKKELFSLPLCFIFQLSFFSWSQMYLDVYRVFVYFLNCSVSNDWDCG